MNIFKSGTNNLAKVVSVLAALILWFHVTTGATFTTLISVPIRYIKPVRGLMVASETPDHVLVLARGTGTSLIAYNFRKLTDENRQYVLVNLAGLSAGTHSITVDRDQILLGTEGITVESIIDNGEFEITLDLKIQRTVTVDTDSIPGLQIARDIAIIGKPTVVPRYVIIEGPGEIVRSVSEVPIKSLIDTRVSLSDTVLQARLDADFMKFVTVDPKQVELHFTVEPLAERSISGVPIRLRDFPWKKRFEAEPDSITVTIAGPRSLVEKIEPSDIIAAVPYPAFMRGLETGSNTVQPVLDYPRGVTGTAVSPAAVRIIPRQPE